MNVQNPIPAGFIRDQNGALWQPCTYEIMNWDMDTDMVKVVNIPVGNWYKNARAASACIRDDADNVYRFVTPGLCSTNDVSVLIQGLASGQINLWRAPGGFFDNVNYSNAVAYLRGWITLWLIVV